MTFELETMTKVRVLDARVLARKDRKPDELAGMKLLLRATLPSTALAMFDGFLPGMLYRKAGKGDQAALDGIEGQELTSIGDHVKRLPWVYEQTGCGVEIDYGTGGTSNLVLSDCKVYAVTLAPKGTGVDVQWTVDAPGLSDETRGRLTGMKATDIQMTQHGPEVADDKQQRIDTEPSPAAKKAKARREAAQTPGTPDRGDGSNWPFPTDGSTPSDAEPAAAH